MEQGEETRRQMLFSGDSSRCCRQAQELLTGAGVADVVPSSRDEEEVAT